MNYEDGGAAMFVAGLIWVALGWYIGSLWFQAAGLCLLTAGFITVAVTDDDTSESGDKALTADDLEDSNGDN